MLDRRCLRSVATNRTLTIFIVMIFFVSFSLGQTKPKFAIAVDYPLSGCLSDALAIADLNGDGFQDLVVVTPASDSNCVSTVADGTISRWVCDSPLGAETEDSFIGLRSCI